MMTVEKTSLIFGILFVLFAMFAWLDGYANNQTEKRTIDTIREKIVAPADQVEWSEHRKAEYHQALSVAMGSNLAVLRIPSTGTDVSVYKSISVIALNRGVGHVSHTALPGAVGNIVIAGHRDGFFRSLKDIQIGAEIQLSSLYGVQYYRVSELMIVDPLDVSVLDPTEEAMLTLITCYPFYFIGPAPERFIVRASLVNKKPDGIVDYIGE